MKDILKAIWDEYSFEIVATVIIGGVGVTIICLALWATSNLPTPYEARHAFMQACLESDLYSRDECLILAAGVGD